MKRLFVGATLAASVTMGMVASAQTQPPAQSQPPATAQTPAQPAQKAADESVTFVGCLQSESDYRLANNLGKGGAAGTGAGAGDEFVLINAAKIPSGPTGTAGTPPPAGTEAYELTGDKEADVKAFIGKRVEITGKLKAAEMGPAGPTGGATAGAPPAGVDAASKDLKLREIDVVSEAPHDAVRGSPEEEPRSRRAVVLVHANEVAGRVARVQRVDVEQHQLTCHATRVRTPNNHCALSVVIRPPRSSARTGVPICQPESLGWLA